MIKIHRIQSISGVVLTALGLTVASAAAVEIYRDEGDLMQNDQGVVFGTTELFQYGWGGGTWSQAVIAPGSNTMALLIAANDAFFGGHGMSCHVEYPAAFTSTAHGPLAEGNVLRLSAWVAYDPAAPLNPQNMEFGVLKFELFGATGQIFNTGATETSYISSLTTSNWTQFVHHYAYDTNDFNVADLQEVRPVIFQGDGSGTTFNGNVVVDNIILEIFADQATADTSPVDPTDPGPLPGPFVFYDITLFPGLEPGTVVEWDSQLGAYYQSQYSDDDGTNWFQVAGVQIPAGDGTRMRTTDPAGPVPGRTYRVIVQPDVAR